MFYLDSRNSGKVNVVVEARGKREDSSLQNQYQLVLSHGTDDITSEKFVQIFTDLEFVKKKENNLGTQLCDLVAYPLATRILYPERKNLAFDVVEPKIYRQFPDGDYLGYGLKIFP